MLEPTRRAADPFAAYARLRRPDAQLRRRLAALPAVKELAATPGPLTAGLTAAYRAEVLGAGTWRRTG